MKFMLVVALLVGSVATAAPVAQARSSDMHTSERHGAQHDADVTFIKWLTDLPNDPSAAGAHMIGRVGGDVGDGTFAGVVLSDKTTPQLLWLAQALYGFNGSKHSFVAYNHIIENDAATPITATIRGVVISGWMKGARVTGEYTLRDNCPIPTGQPNVFNPSCFQGTLHLHSGDD